MLCQMAEPACLGNESLVLKTSRSSDRIRAPDGAYHAAEVTTLSGLPVEEQRCPLQVLDKIGLQSRFRKDHPCATTDAPNKSCVLSPSSPRGLQLPAMAGFSLYLAHSV